VPEPALHLFTLAQGEVAMRTTLKIVLPLIISVVLVSLFYAAYQVRTQSRMARNDLARHAGDLAESLRENVEQVFDKPVPEKGLQRLVDRFGQREDLRGIVVYNANGTVLAATPGLSTFFKSRPATATHAALQDSGFGEFVHIDDAPMHLYAMPLHRNGQAVGTLLIVHETSYIDTLAMHTLRDSLLSALIQTLFITVLAIILVRLTLTGPLTRTAKWL